MARGKLNREYIDGVYVDEYLRNYSITHNISLREIAESIGRGETFISTMTRDGMAIKSDLIALSSMYGVDMKRALAKHTKRKINGSADTRFKTIPEANKYIEGRVNAINDRTIRIEYMLSALCKELGMKPDVMHMTLNGFKEGNDEADADN